MIKFFRRIRSKLIDEGNQKKYLIYALGEIFLVMVGILLALQVNNWNELRKKENAEIELYHKIITDLNTENAIIERKIRDLNAHQNFHFRLYNEMQGKAAYDPTINYKQLYIYSGVKLFFDENHSKTLSVLKDEETYNLLKKYIDQEKITTSANNEWNKIKIEQVRPFLAKYGIKNTDAVFSVKSSDDWLAVSAAQLISYPKLKEQYGTNEFNQLLYELRVYTTWVLDNYNSLKESNRTLESFLKNKVGIEQKSSELGTPPLLLEFLLKAKSVDEIIYIIRNENPENPENPRYDISEPALNNFGYVLIEKGQLNDAKKVFEVGIELYPNAYNLYDSYGECLFKLNEYDSAAKAFNRALELNPESVNSKRMLEELKTIRQ